MKAIILRELASLDVESQLAVRELRNEPSVRSVMYTDHGITVNEHLAWVARLKADRRQIVFAALEDGKPVGVASVNALDRLHRKADWAFYLAPAVRGGLGAAIEMAVITFAFGPLGLEKPNCEVIDGNDAVVRMHEKFGFRREGFRAANIIKNGHRIGVHFLGLRKDEWDATAVRERHASLFNRFDVQIDWQESTDERAVDRIEAARARNNINWMTILRLAVENSPEAARKLIAEIQRTDREIIDLTSEVLADIDDVAADRELSEQFIAKYDGDIDRTRRSG